MATKTAEKNTKKKEATKEATPKKATPSKAMMNEAKKQVKEEMKGKMSDLILSNWNSLVAGFGTFSPSKQWDIALQMMPYITPKMQSNEINGEVHTDPLSSQLGQLANARVSATPIETHVLDLGDTSNTPSS